MKANMRNIVALGVIVQLVCLGYLNLQPARAATNISSIYKYAWNENVGWQNWRSANGQATVGTTYLVGYVWAENIGWIKLGSDGGGPYNNDASDDWGVNRNSSTGALSGYAWSENVGWINFRPTHGGVTINMANSNKFEGYAWGENIGWIHFQYSSTDPAYEYYVQQDGPLVVNLVSFSARGLEDRVLLKWETASEIDTAGFNLLRSRTKGGTYVRITQTLIPAKGGPTSGATYTHEDTDVTQPQIWYYKLEDIDNSGTSTFHGPILGVVGDAAVKEVNGPTTIGEGNTAQGMGEIIIEGTGQHTVTTGKYADNPAGAPTFTPTGGYWFLDVTNPTGVNSVTVRFCPAQSSDTVYYWNGGDWIKCSGQAYADGCIAVKITDTTSPRISDLTSLVFAMGGQSAAVPTLTEWGALVLFLILGTGAVLALRRRRLRLGTGD